LGIFPFATGSGAHPIQWEPGAVLSMYLQRPGREADRSSPCNAEVKNAWS